MVQRRLLVEQGGTDEVQVTQGALQAMAFAAFAVMRADGGLDLGDGGIVGRQRGGQGSGDGRANSAGMASRRRFRAA
jgi:hypothetical protein